MGDLLIKFARSSQSARSLEALIASEAVKGAAPQPDSPIQRVAIFTEAFLPKVDGVSRTALLTIKYLQSTGRQVIVFAPSPTLSTVAGTPIYSVPSLGMPYYSEVRVAPPWPFILPRLRRFQPDLIHLFSPVGLGSLGMAAGEWLNVPVIANYQTDLPAYAHSYGYDFFRLVLIDLLRYIHNGCTLTLAPSTATRDELRAWHFRRLRLWQRGIDTERFSPARRDPAWRARLLAGRDPARLLVLYVGRMAREKHVPTLHTLARTPGIALTLVGGGEYQPTLEQLFANSDAHFTGYLLGDDLAQAYAAADVFVFPGPEETFGQVILEAMASGLPVIVTERGGPRTLVTEGQNGFICAVDDEAAFAERVSRLRDDPQLRVHMSDSARAYADARPWITIMRQLEGYYTEAWTLHRRLRAFRKAIRQ